MEQTTCLLTHEHACSRNKLCASDIFHAVQQCVIFVNELSTLSHTIDICCCHRLLPLLIHICLQCHSVSDTHHQPLQLLSLSMHPLISHHFPMPMVRNTAVLRFRRLLVLVLELLDPNIAPTRPDTVIHATDITLTVGVFALRAACKKKRASN
jgi:hypothetical protein